MVIFSIKGGPLILSPRSVYIFEKESIFVQFTTRRLTRLKQTDYLKSEKGNVHIGPWALSNGRSDFRSSCPTNNFQAHAQ